MYDENDLEAIHEETRLRARQADEEAADDYAAYCYWQARQPQPEAMDSTEECPW